jgi:hypothetical protein
MGGRAPCKILSPRDGEYDARLAAGMLCTCCLCMPLSSLPLKRKLRGVM